jgi:hypothetical protein
MKTTPVIWIDGIISMSEAERLHLHQHVNKIPYMDYICYKSTLFKALNHLRRRYPVLMAFYPLIYLLLTLYPKFQRFHSILSSKRLETPF